LPIRATGVTPAWLAGAGAAFSNAAKAPPVLVAAEEVAEPPGGFASREANALAVAAPAGATLPAGAAGGFAKADKAGRADGCTEAVAGDAADSGAASNVAVVVTGVLTLAEPAAACLPSKAANGFVAVGAEVAVSKGTLVSATLGFAAESDRSKGSTGLAWCSAGPGAAAGKGSVDAWLAGSKRDNAIGEGGAESSAEPSSTSPPTE
jgi:hypothetical protein